VVLVLVACGDDGSSDPSKGRDRNTRARIEAELREETADKAARVKAAELADRQRQLDDVSAQIDGMVERIAAAEKDLHAATTEAERAAALGRMEKLRDEFAAMRERLEALTGKKPKCPPSVSSC
jgi:predicted  nucleic acid-binding Zn-ribbon protein